MTFFCRQNINIAICVALILIGFGGNFSIVSGQNVDSLKKELLREDVSDTSKIVSCIKLGDHYVRTKPDSAKKYFSLGLTLANKWLKENPDDSLQLANRATIYNDFGVSYYYLGNYEKVEEYWYKAIEDEKKIKDYSGIATAHNNLGQIYLTIGDTRKAVEEIKRAVQIKKKHGLVHDLSNSLSNLAYCYDILGDVKTAINTYNEALTYTDKDNPLEVGGVLTGLALIYKKQGNPEMALDKFQEALKLYAQANAPYKLAEVQNNIGSVHSYYERYDTALYYFQKTLEMYDTLGYKKGRAMTSNNIAYCYEKLGRYDEALEILDTTIKINLGLNYVDGLQYNYKIKGDVFEKKGMTDSALFCYEKALNFSEQTEILETQFEVSLALSNLYAETSNWKKAFEQERNARQIADSIFNSETKEAAVRNEMQYEFDKKQLQEKLEQEKKEALAREALRRQRIITISVSAGIILLLIFFVVLYRKFKQTRKQKVLIETANEELNHQNEEIMAQRDQIEKQRALVQEKNEEILSSIEYAKRIQQAILPPSAILKTHLPDSFVLYMPKDVVAGDFYWMEVVDEMVFFAAADCTGHGVPGAMVSVVCHGALNRCVREYGLIRPADILNKTRELVLNTFEKSEEQVKDGMDISLCSWNKKNNQIQYAGANNPLYMVKKSSGEVGIEIIKADKEAIGYVRNPTSFTNHELQIDAGDVIYLFSDGYADQFGGAKGKKMGYKKFRELLRELSEEDLPRQKEVLREHFIRWKGKEEQIDDVCIMGVRL